MTPPSLRSIMLVLLLALAAALAGCGGPAAVLREGTPYTPEQYASAIEPGESEVFSVGFRLCAAPEGQDSAPDSQPVHYDLLLTNRTGQTLRGVRITAGLSQKLCDALVSPIWYNEPNDIAAGGTAHYVWEPQLLLSRASGPMTEELRTMLIEITWDGGSELLRLHAGEGSMPEEYEHLLEELPPLHDTSPVFPTERYATDQ